MSPSLRSILPLSLTCALILGGCAGHPQRTSGSEGMQSVVAPAPQRSQRPSPSRQMELIPKNAGPSPAQAGPNEMVGVASCDQYLSTYKACHRAAGIFAPDQIDARYDMMRGTLLRDAKDPAKRAALDQRCRALSKQLNDALHGKSCNAVPVPASTAGG